MTSVWLKLRWAAIPLMSWGLAACSASDDVTTQSVTPAQKVAIAEPDCGSLKTEIDKLNAAKLPEKLQQAGAKKYSPTPDEWSAFPRYNNLVETYTVKKCEPGLQQAKAAPSKPKVKAATTPAKTADAGAAMAAAGKPAAAAASAKPAAAAAAVKAPVAKAAAKATVATPAAMAQPQQPQYQGVTLQMPPQPAEPKQ
jgi:hypothetical protein